MSYSSNIRNTFRVFHTADWHLGQRFCHQDRIEEHQLFLDWLLQEIDARQPQMLIIAGDIFDTSTPPQTAQTQYYQFLARLIATQIQHVVIVAGNHDSPRLIDAPAELLKHLSIHTVGFAPENPADCILHIRDRKTQELQALVGAVPFLRESDVRRSVAGENYSEVHRQVVSGIQKYYLKMAESWQEERSVPRILTGHLFAQGITDSESDEIIHVGNQGKVAAEAFPESADYVALGHIHKQQIVGGRPHIRYSGSPIPLSFSEANQKKCILELDFEGTKLQNIEPVEVPTFRPIYRIKANNAKELDKGIDMLSNEDTKLEAWIEVTLSERPQHSDWKKELEDVAERRKVRVLSCPLDVPNEGSPSLASAALDDSDLESLKPIDIFKSYYASRNSQELTEELVSAYNSILEELQNEIPE